MIRRHRLWMAATSLAMAMAGCGAAGAPAAYEQGTAAGGAAAEPQVVQPTPAEQQVVADYDQDMQALDADFMSNLELSTGPDCDLARDLRDRICDLADRICDIAGRHPGYGDVGEQCEDGRGRCDRARDRVADSCGEE